MDSTFLASWLSGWVSFSAFWSLYLCPFWFPLVASASDPECHDPSVPCMVSFLGLSFLWSPWPTTAFNSPLHNEVILNDISTLSSTHSKAWYYLYLHLDTASFCCEKSCNYFTVTYPIFHALTDLKFKHRLVTFLLSTQYNVIPPNKFWPYILFLQIQKCECVHVFKEGHEQETCSFFWVSTDHKYIVYFWTVSRLCFIYTHTYIYKYTHICIHTYTHIFLSFYVGIYSAKARIIGHPYCTLRREGV